MVLRTDVIRKFFMGVPPETRLPPEAYEETVTDKVYGALFEQAEQVLRAGHAVIIDAVSRYRVSAWPCRTGGPARGAVQWIVA